MTSWLIIKQKKTRSPRTGLDDLLSSFYELFLQAHDKERI